MKTGHEVKGIKICRWARCLVAVSAGLAIFAMMQSDAQAQLRNRYSFSNPAGAAVNGVSIVEDLVGTADGIVRGANGMFTGTGLTLPGGEHVDGGAYVDLPNGLASSLHDNATFEMWYTLATFQNFTRIFDFGSAGGTEIIAPGISPAGGAGDTFCFGPTRGNVDQQRTLLENDEAAFWAPSGGPAGVVSGGNILLDTNVVQALNTLQHVVVTVIKDADGGGLNIAPRLTVFHNGGQVGTLVGAEANAFQLENLNDVNAWLGKSNYSGDNQLHGTLDEFRIYEHAFTASDAGKDFILGPEREGELLKLVVDTNSGNVSMVNEQDDLAIAIDYYRITSAMGALDSGAWTSLDDGESNDPLGQGWDEAVSSANSLQEFVLDPDGELFGAAGTESLGGAFDNSVFGAGNEGDLVFEYGGPSGFIIQGLVEYVTNPNPLGDYNEDGTVNAADYTVYRNCKAGLNGCTMLPNDGGAPGVTTADYTFWKAHYGETGAGAGSSVDGGGDVPEPTTLASLLYGLLVVGLSRRPARRRAVH